VAPLLIALVAGCVTLDVDEGASKGPPLPCPSPCQIVTTWENRVHYSPDPTRGGTPGPGLAGRLYLFGELIGTPLAGDGSLEVLLSDETNGPAVQKEAWVIDAATFKTLLRRDRIGWGYTMFLPWTTYRSDITKARIKVCYKPAKGAPIYFESPVTLASENGVVTSTVKTEVLGKPKS
jgi:hypothetical protein